VYFIYVNSISLNDEFIGGYLKNMMDCADFGIPKRNSFILEGATRSPSQTTFLLPCPPKSFWMANYGTY